MAQPGHSPFRDGFAALWHEPALFAAELTWRWCFGLAAWSLVIASGAWFLDSLTISPGDRFLLNSLQPQLLSSALRHIFRGSLSRFLWEQIVLLAGLTLLWTFAATAGRVANLRRLIAMFSADEDSSSMSWGFAEVFVLTLLRAMWTLIAVAGVLISLAGGVVLAHDHRAGRAAAALAFGIGLSWAFGTVLNWFFGLAPLFCVRNRVAAPEGLIEAADFLSRQSGRLIGLGLVFGIIRLIWAGTMFFVLFAPLKLTHHLAPGWIALVMGMVLLLYFAGADLLYLARLGAYVSLAEDESRAPETPEVIAPLQAPALEDPVPLVGPA